MRNFNNYLKNILCLSVPFIIWIYFFSPFINFKFTHVDTTVYILGAKKVISGSIPYRDFFDNKPPLIFYLFAVILNFFGKDNYVSITYSALFFSLVSTVLLFYISLILTNRFTATLTAILYPVISNLMLLSDAINPNTELYAQSFALCGMLCGLISSIKNKSLIMVVAGICVGTASAFKQPFASNLIPLSILSISGFTAGINKKTPVFLIGGFCSVWLFIALYFIFNKAGSDLLDQCFVLNLIYATDGTVIERLCTLVYVYMGFAIDYPAALSLYFAGIIILVLQLTLLRNTGKTKKYGFVNITLFIFAWNISDALATAQGGFFYPHYWIQFIPSMLIVMFVPLYNIIPLRIKRVRIISVFASVVYLSLAAYYAFLNKPDMKLDIKPNVYYPPSSHKERIKKITGLYGKTFFSYPLFYSPKIFYEIKSLVRTVRLNSSEYDKIFIWGFNPELYLLTGRQPSSKFFYTVLVNRDSIGGNNHNDKNIRSKQNKILSLKLIDELVKNKPKLIITTVDNTVSPKPDFLLSFINRHYIKLNVTYGYEEIFNIYAKRESTKRY